MKIEIRNIRGVASGQMDIAPLAFVAGLNGAGKSSAATAVAAALMQTPAPIPGMTKTAARDLLRDHCERGRVIIEGKDGRVAVNYPGGKVTVEGQPPQASAVACGMISPATMTDKARAQYLIDTLKATPSSDDLFAALRAIKVADAAIDACWKRIEADGWDATHRYAQQRATEAKGAWGHITGEQYGSRKAEDWQPAVFADAALPTPEEATAAVDAARQNVETVVANQAVARSEVERLQGMIDQADHAATRLAEIDEKIADWQQQLSALGEQLQAIKAKADAKRQQVEELPKPGQVPVTAPCPSCGTHLIVVTRQELRAAEGGPDEPENQRRQEAIDAGLTEAADIEAKAAPLRHQASIIQSDIANLQGEQRHLHRAGSAKDLRQQLAALNTEGSTHEDVIAARQDLEQAEYRLAALHQVRDAATKHRAVVNYTMMSEVLAPSGLRQTVLSTRLDEVNAALDKISRTARWGRVGIEPDFSITLSGRRYDLLSESEQFRVRVTLQLVFARIEGSDAVVVDAADILDRHGRNGILAAVSRSSLPAIITMTMDDPASMPRLEESGKGASYWVSDGVLDSQHRPLRKDEDNARQEQVSHAERTPSPAERSD